jgi:hypothetical protein
MPGLLRGVARTAVVAGTATAVSGRVARRQAEKFADRDANIYAQREQAYEQQMAPPPPQYAPPPPQAAPPPPAAGGTDDMITQLQKLGELRDQGILTDEEFAAEKAKVLARG